MQSWGCVRFTFASASVLRAARVWGISRHTLVQECSEVQPKLLAHSVFAQEKSVSLNNLNADEVTRAMENVLSGKAWSVPTEDGEHEHQNLLTEDRVGKCVLLVLIKLDAVQCCFRMSSLPSPSYCTNTEAKLFSIKILFYFSSKKHQLPAVVSHVINQLAEKDETRQSQVQHHTQVYKKLLASKTK